MRTAEAPLLIALQLLRVLTPLEIGNFAEHSLACCKGFCVFEREFVKLAARTCVERGSLVRLLYGFRISSVGWKFVQAFCSWLNSLRSIRIQCRGRGGVTQRVKRRKIFFKKITCAMAADKRSRCTVLYNLLYSFWLYTGPGKAPIVQGAKSV